MVEKFVTQRLFGRTVIDSLDLNQNAWYIDEEQVTATAAELNAAGDGITTINAYNGTGGAFAAGMLLHVSSYDPTSGYLIVEKADADNSKPAQYVATNTTASLGTTIVVDYLDSVSFNTTGAAAGDPVYLSAATPGAFSLSAPTGADDVVQIVGRVKLHNSASGTVIIDLRKTEQSQIGTNEIVGKSITAAKLGSDVAGTGLTGGNGAAIAIAGKGVTASMLNADIAGNGLSGADGSALALDFNELSAVLVDVSADSLPYLDATGSVSVRTTFANLATTMSGEGLASASGTINLYDKGQTSHGGVFFTGSGTCDALTITNGTGTVTYPRSATVQDAPVGQWTSASGTAAGNATSLAAAISGDQRNAGGPYYTAYAYGDGVVIMGLTPGTASNATLALTGTATQPSTLQNLAEGRNGKTCQVGTVYHTVTTLDTLLTQFTLELPFAPDTWIVQVLSSTGVMKDGITDTFTFGSSPNGVKVTAAGGTHVAAGDIITVLAISL